MNLLNKVWFIVAFLMVSATVMGQTIIGYTTGKMNKNECVHLGTTDKQGMAFYVDAEKAVLLKGASVESFIAHVGTTYITNGKFFITRELDGASLCEMSFKPSSSRERMYEYKLDNPYILDGEPFYVGYVGDVTTTYRPLSYDLSNNFEAGISWAYKDGQWIDVSQQGLGAPNIQLKVSGVNAFTDLTVKPVIPMGYQVAGKAQVFEGQLFNFGSETVTSFELTCKVGNTAPVTTQVTGLSLASGSTYDFTLPEYLTNETGTLDLEVTVSNVNGATDAETTDNMAKSSVFFYPAGVEKKILIETFTGQTCPNCPTGHTVLANALDGIEDEFIEVSHHSGYYPDMFTLKESYAYTWLYGTSGTYAPAAMFNRSLVNDISTTSVVFATTDAVSTRAAVQAFRNTQPYVDIKMYNEYVDSTRTGKLTVDVYTYVVPSDSMHTLNVWMVQDGLVAMQSSGGSAYVHNHVFRGTLNNSAWGQQIHLSAGESRRYTFDYTIPDSISSNYGNMPGTFAAIPADMQLVAFVSDYSQTSPTSCNVYNAAKVPVLSSSQSIDKAEVSPSVLFSYNGSQMNIVGDFLQADFYTASGALATSLKKGQHTFNLPAGLYVVRTLLSSGMVDVQKLLIK